MLAPLALKLLCMLVTSHSGTDGNLLQKLCCIKSGWGRCSAVSLLLLLLLSFEARPAAAVTAAAAAPAAPPAAVAVTAHTAAVAAMVCTAARTSVRVVWSSMNPPWMRSGLYDT
jgi:hypothetical protein